MKFSPYYPYKSEAARDSYLAHYGALAATEWPVASEERMAATSYGQTFVRIAGPTGAPPLVLLPGACATSLMWAPNIQTLSKACRTYAVDRIGEVGRSICTRPVRSPDDLVAWLSELFDALKLDRVNLAGVSYGGWLTALYALHCPARLNRAVLIAPGGGVLRVSAQFLVRVALLAVSGRWGLPSLFRWIFADLAHSDPKQFDTTVERVLIATRAFDPGTALPLKVFKSFTDAEWSDFRVPALFLVGEHERIYSADKAVRRLRQVAPRVRSEIIRGAGHDLTMVQAEAVNRLMVEFLTQEAAATQLAGTAAP